MNFLVDCHSFDSKISQGITTYISGIYRYLPNFAPDINFYFAASNIDAIKKIFGEGDNIKYIKLSSKQKWKRLLFEFPLLIKKHHIDVAHFQYISPLLKNCKTIVTLHDILFIDYPQYFPYTYRLSKGVLFRLSAMKSDLLCTVSGYSKDQIVHHYKIDSNRILITPNAVLPDFKKIEGERPRNFPLKYILYVSRIEPRKNHIAIIKAFTRLNLAQKGYTLVLIGKETVTTPEFHEIITNEKFNKNIRLIPQVDCDTLKLWYKHASLFIYPSIAEGFGIPPLEAAMAGTKVISNNSTAMADFTFFGDNLIDISDSKLLDNRIMEALNAPSNMRMIAETKKIIASKYNWETIAHNFNNSLNYFRDRIIT